MTRENRPLESTWGRSPKWLPSSQSDVLRDLRRNGAKLRCVRDPEVIDSELRLLLAIRHMAREADGRVPKTARIDTLLDERSAAATG